MEKQGTNDPTSGSEGKKDGETIRETDDEHPSTNRQTATSPNKRESNIQEETEAAVTNRETNESEKRLSEMVARLDEMGPTVSRYQHDEASNEVRRLSSEMKGKAVATMIHHLRLMDSASSKCQKGPIALGNSNPSQTILTSELRLKELEKRINIFTKRINEHRREQAHTAEKIQVLEAKATLDDMKDFIKDFLTRVPTETDLQNLESIRLMMMKRKQAESRIRFLNMRASALNKAMAAIAKSKGLGITDQEQPVAAPSINCSSQRNSCDASASNSYQKQLPDFTQMPPDVRDNFLAKNFSQRVSDSDENQQQGLVLETGMTGHGSPSDYEDEANPSDDGSAKVSDNSGVTIVTMNSEETSEGPETVDTDFTVVGSVDEQQQPPEPESPVDNAQAPEEVSRRDQEAGTSSPKDDENSGQSEQINKQL